MTRQALHAGPAPGGTPGQEAAHEPAGVGPGATLTGGSGAVPGYRRHRPARSPLPQRWAWPQRRWVWVAVRSYLAGAPGTLIYLFTLSVTWWTLRGADPKLSHHLITSASTNLHNLARNPVQVLIISAFWESGSQFPWQLILGFLLIMVAVERWVGTRAWLITFAAGHIGATLITAVGLAYAVRHGLLPAKIAGTSDVGTSYGFYAVAALLTYRFTPRWQLAAAGSLIAYLTISAWHGRTFTDYGHLAALSIGFAAYPVRHTLVRWARRRSGRGFPAHGPNWKP